MRTASDAHVGLRVDSTATASAPRDVRAIGVARHDEVVRAPAPNASFERAVIPLLPGLRLQALRLTRGHADADDLMQETLLRAYRFWPRYQERDQCRAWLQRILHNTFRSEYRRQARRKAQLIELEAQLREDSSDAGAGLVSEESAALRSAALECGSAQRVLPDAPTPLPGPVAPQRSCVLGAPVPEAHELDDRLSTSLSSLSVEHRSVIWLVDVKERSYREAAAELACPIGTIMSRLHRARAALRSAVLTQP